MKDLEKNVELWYRLLDKQQDKVIPAKWYL
jgi:hypothetical protein